ncbi:hypothetical protein ACIG3E_16555 [Streptomyces sp. NPDC053474]
MVVPDDDARDTATNDVTDTDSDNDVTDTDSNNDVADTESNGVANAVTT